MVLVLSDMEKPFVYNMTVLELNRCLEYAKSNNSNVITLKIMPSNILSTKIVSLNFKKPKDITDLDSA
jgi:hypothetical protein